MCDKKNNDILGMGPRILIVEDNQRLARLERERLAERMPDCEIRLAFAGTVARAMLQQYQWDLVLLDLAIPPPDGMSLLRWMSRQPTMPPVIVASGCSDEKIQQQALQLGAKYFMIKPYHLDDMADNVRMLLSVRETDDGALDPEKQAYLQRARAYLLRMTDHLEAEGFRYVLMGVENYYDGSTVTIPLDPKLGGNQNAQKYYKEYKRKQTAVKMLTKLIRQGEIELEYLNSVAYNVASASGEKELMAIREELHGAGYLKYYKNRDKKQKPRDFIRYTSSDGFLILVGRNNLQNERLTMKTARGKDMWFHVKKAPGSHVVVMSEGRDIPLKTQNEAAMLAVHHSSLKGSPKVEVDYTFVKNIRKTADLKPGMVIYDVYESAPVTVDEKVLAELVRIK